MIGELEALTFEPLPDRVSMEDITGGAGHDPHLTLTENYNRAVELAYRAFQYHFEFLNLGYVAYLDFFGFCKEAFPGISDLGIAKMVQGIEVDLFKPDDELKKLARLAVELDVAGPLSRGTVDEALAAVAAAPRGDEWVAAWEAAKDPWFNFSSGSGMYSDDKVWLDHPDIPLGFVRDYVAPRAGGPGHRSADASRSPPSASGSRASTARCCPTTRRARRSTRSSGSRGWCSRTSRTTTSTSSTGRCRCSGATSASSARCSPTRGSGPRRTTSSTCAATRSRPRCSTSATAGPSAPTRWASTTGRRSSPGARRSSRRSSAKTPPPAMNEPPAVITEPFTIMLFGITTERVGAWLSGSEDSDELTGMAASPGRAEGIARVVMDTADLAAVQDGEILVTRVTAPSWGPVFDRLGAVVTDIGGMMSHAAIICREYGLPAVTGAGSATVNIQTGDRVVVDGDAGTVSIVS